MNKIEALPVQDDVSGTEYLMIFIDGQPLDGLLSSVSPEDELFGLVPVLMPWLADEHERAIVWSRFLPKDSVRRRTPVLMCPEHLSLTCTTIVAEVQVLPDAIEWRRVGIDDTPEEDLPDLVGQDVYWVREIPPMRFKPEEYRRVMDVFRAFAVPGQQLH